MEFRSSSSTKGAFVFLNLVQKLFHVTLDRLRLASNSIDLAQASGGGLKAFELHEDRMDGGQV